MIFNIVIEIMLKSIKITLEISLGWLMPTTKELSYTVPPHPQNLVMSLL